jgi:hypothetical protein
VVVGEVVGGERATLAILEPLLADLVAADVEVPHVFGHAAKTAGAGAGLFLGAAGVDPDGAVRISEITTGTNA